MSEQDFTETYNQAQKTKRLINGFISYLKGKKLNSSIAAPQHGST
jgi:hypothetical protein